MPFFPKRAIRAGMKKYVYTPKKLDYSIHKAFKKIIFVIFADGMTFAYQEFIEEEKSKCLNKTTPLSATHR